LIGRKGNITWSLLPWKSGVIAWNHAGQGPRVCQLSTIFKNLNFWKATSHSREMYWTWTYICIGTWKNKQILRVIGVRHTNFLVQFNSKFYVNPDFYSHFLFAFPLKKNSFHLGRETKRRYLYTSQHTWTHVKVKSRYRVKQKFSTSVQDPKMNVKQTENHI
jgi:hypothetical protein